ncbi:ral GTPase-activating protein subunit beta isoform X2 [Chrysoperla carnea]|uniref:ral GTPase-activating protein subunit beta isoform X2 n=1 Tax=Chrysoperla carnea TaxID=189513 RepID=UPI001D06DCB2|nr:ral GTPase-activating protein subunit beta isoform X2 [Chrysoperla carnea]
MNLGVFNKVNLKVNAEGKGMYGEWTSLTSIIQNNIQEGTSVLDKLDTNIGKDVALQVVRQLATNLGIAQAAEPSPLTTDREVLWYMEVICYGLTLPLAEHDTIRDCVNVYCEWLSALDTVPKISVPKPVYDDPNLYARKIIIHFQNLFVPRKDEGVDAINRQAVLCHRVLRTLQHLAQTSRHMTKETWDCLLLFLISVNDTLLAPPNLNDASADVGGDQLCERVLGVLFEVWLLACGKCFPSPPLWKTMRENCMKWRHHVALIEQWNRINLALTARLLSFMYGPTFPELKISEEDAQLIPPDMSNDCIAQSWFRFLHCIGNPVNLCRPSVISQTDKFLQFAIGNDGAIDPTQHPCLNNLPLIFHKAVKGFSGLVDAFLGIGHAYSWEDSTPIGIWEKGKDHRSSINESHSTTTPPTQRRLAKSFSVNPSTVTKGLPKSALTNFASSRSSSVQAPTNSGPSSTSSLTSNLSLHHDWRYTFTPNRPKCNSILHLFGEWLFEAAFIGTDQEQQFTSTTNEGSKRSSTLVEDPPSSGSSSNPPSSSGTGTSFNDFSPALMAENYESGRAEAIGTLCRVFCAKKTGEEILTVYSARFYLAIQCGLKQKSHPPGESYCDETMASILLNSADLFKLELQGIQVLIPSFMSALEIVLPEKDLKLKSNTISKIELRRASIQILLSLLVLPLHYQNLTIRDMLSSNMPSGDGGSGMRGGVTTFIQLKPRLMNLLINALQVEVDTYNTHMLLGGLLLSVQDSATYELTDCFIQSRTNSETNSNLLSSDSAHALFVRATYLVCHRLISSWKTDLNVSLAALELLMGLSRINIKESDALECKRAVKWLCDYIIYQCWRPPQAHSKDLHSTIVAAFHCCSVWLVAHPYLLQDKDCLYTALEVAELGISGTKSIGKPGESITMKDEKQLKPASMRVRESAEYLLSTIMEQVGYFPSDCGAESLSSLLNEVTLLKHCNLWSGNSDAEEAVQHFRYFVAENSTILALLEEPLGNDQDPQPTVTLIIRGPFGRYAWTMQLRHLPRHKSGSKYHAPNSGRPVAMNEPQVQPQVHQTYFPESVDRIPTFKVDTCIPTLDSLVSSENSFEFEQFTQLLERQSSLETAFLKKNNDTDHEYASNECTPPNVCHEFQTARLFLSHFGFISYDTPTDPDDEQIPRLTALDSSLPGFWSELENLDRMSARTCDTVHIFYVGAGQQTAEEIVSNVTHESNVSSVFLQFLTTLGWPVDVSYHPGWTGHMSTSWNFDVPENGADQNKVNEMAQQHGGSLYNGEKQVLYWSDVSSEIAFVVPSKCKIIDNASEESLSTFDGSSFKNWYDNDDQSTKSRSSVEFERQTSLGDSGRRRNTTRAQMNQHADAKIMIAWLENYEDHLYFPIDDLLQCMQTSKMELHNPPKASDVIVIYLHELKSGLLRVHLKGPSSRMNLATPLVDGMIVSSKILGPLVRQTALNMAKRRRLDCDMYQPPHVRRRVKIQDITNNYKRKMTQPELLTSLFSGF